MKVKVNINGVDTEIILTQEQVAEIRKESPRPNVIARVRSFEDALDELGILGAFKLPYENPKTPFEKSVNAYAKLAKIIEALNQGWTPDYRNDDEPKFFPWLKANPSGLGLSYHGCVCDDSGSNSVVDSRLVLKTEELAKYVGQQFIDIYNEYNNTLES